jgi:TonB family protein
MTRMPIRIVKIPLQMEQAAGTTGGPSRNLWLGYIASGVSHLAGGLFLGSVWGTALIQLVPPPYGMNAIQLTASQTVALDATMEEEPGQAMLETTMGVENSKVATGSLPRAQQQIRPDVGEMPPAWSIVDQVELMETALARGLEQASPRPVMTPPKKPIHDARHVVKPESTRLFKKSVVPPPPVTSDAVAAPAMPSTQRQGQDAESLPQKVYSPTPTYPASALRQGLTGRVVLRVHVDADGAVVSAGVLRSSGHPILDDAALAGVRQWRFQPARQLGVAIEQKIAVPITFRIDRSL